MSLGNHLYLMKMLDGICASELLVPNNQMLGDDSVKLPVALPSSSDSMTMSMRGCSLQMMQQMLVKKRRVFVSCAGAHTHTHARTHAHAQARTRTRARTLSC